MSSKAIFTYFQKFFLSQKLFKYFTHNLHLNQRSRACTISNNCKPEKLILEINPQFPIYERIKPHIVSGHGNNCSG